MQAIVLSHEPRHAFVELVLRSYEHWPCGDFVFRVPFTTRPPAFRTERRVEPVRAAEPVGDTMAALLEGIADDEFVYWCTDDRYLDAVLDRAALESLDAWVRSGAELPFDALRLLNHTPPGPGAIAVGTARVHEHRAETARGFWHHSYVRAGVLRECFLGSRRRDCTVEEVNRDLRAGRFRHRILSATDSLVRLGETTILGRITANCVEAFARVGLAVPAGFPRCDARELFPNAR